MGYKWIGAVMIVSGCTGVGFRITYEKRKEENLLNQMLQLLQFLESELLYKLTSLPELSRMAAGEAKGILRTVFMNLYRELSWQKLPDAGSCMSAAIQRSGEIPSSTRRLLVQLGYTLGRYDLPGQLEGIQSVRKRCEDALQNCRMNRDDRLRCYQTLSVCAGAALAILLV